MADLWDNPIQTDGFEFVEYAAPDPRALESLELDQVRRGVLKPAA
jgi:4-hydroxyphenylpyruvate dioxygenase